ncbi:MAG: GntR family transcriptional regulator [Desulfobacterales bacterium]|nr:GntR family transcriptional regulator [Desulfobacterales bacterium]
MADNKSYMKSLQAYEKIRDMILSGVKLPGTRLVLSELEAELDLGRGPIREALMRLDRSGLVKNIPYKGAIVATPPTQKEILHIYDLRAALEAKLAVEAIDKLTDADFRKLEELLKQMDALPQNHYQLDREFHRIICAASGLPHLCHIAQTLVQSVESVLNIYRREKDHCTRFNAEHRAIFDALKSKDPKRVKKTFEVNIKSGLEIIKDTYSKLLKVPFE